MNTELIAKNVCKKVIVIFISIWVLVPLNIHSQNTIPYKMQNVKIVAGGFITGIDFHPNEKGLAYVRTDIGGAYRLDTASKTWIPLNDQFSGADWNYYGIDAIGLDPSDPERLYLGAGTYTNGWAGNGAILRSTDRGDNFEITNLPFMLGGNEDGRSTGEKLIVDPNSGNILYLGTRRNGLWKSQDYGVTWAKITSFPVGAATTNNIGVTFVLFDASRGVSGNATSTIYVGTADKDSNLYVSTNSGETWNKVPGQPVGMMPHHARLTGTGYMYLSYADGPGPNGINTGAIWKLNINDNTWTKLKVPDGQGGFGGLTMDANNSDILMVGTMDRWWPGDEVYRSVDGGTSWKAITPSDVRDVTVSPYVTWHKKLEDLGSGNWIGDIEIDPFNSNSVYYGTGATLWGCHNITNLENNLPTNWQIDANGIEETSILEIASPPAGPSLYSVIGDISGFSHDDINVSPPEGFFSIDGGTNTGIDFAYNYPNFVVRVGNNSSPIAYSNDYGKTWTPFKTIPLADSKAGKVAVSADGLSTVWIPDGKKPHVTHSNGISWTECIGLSIGAKVIADKVNAKIFYASNIGAFYKSTDSGSTFLKVGTVSASSKIEAVPGKEGYVWAASSTGLFKSIDGGVNFNKIAGPTSVESVGFGMPAAGDTFPTIYIIGTIDTIYGVFRNNNLSETWSRVNDNKHQYGGIHDIIGDPRVFGRYYLCTNGRGIIYGEPISDCNGDSMGTATIDACGVCVGGNTGLSACEVPDCNGDLNGTAYTDQCSECVGGNTGKSPCYLNLDCNGDTNGNAVLDECNVCVGGNTGLEACIVDIQNTKYNNFNIYPNPSKTSFTLTVNLPSTYSIIDASGKVYELGVCENNIVVGKKLESGFYILLVKNSTDTKSIKLIKD